ncbi:hypothetical protein [Burkholderia vietnamiensis]|uniref:hypothetical protein n=1 Tax=Burkholderia vietnamiensis TaxID=60552 RepID=UPI001FC9B4A2|nr:hypothetical protein [Burkholderia vietnamiensis]
MLKALANMTDEEIVCEVSRFVALLSDDECAELVGRLRQIKARIARPAAAIA